MKKKWKLIKNIFSKPKFWQVCAHIFTTLGAREKAIKCIQKGLCVDTNNSKLHLMAANIFLKRGQIDKAAFHYKKAVNLNEPVSYLYWLVNTKYEFHNATCKFNYKNKNRRILNKNDNLSAVSDAIKSGDIDRTLKLLNNIHESGTNSSSAYNNAATFLLKSGKTQEAYDLLQKASRVSKDPAIFANIGLALSKMGNYKKALFSFEKAQLLGINTPELLNNKGYALFCLGRDEEAITCFELAHQMAPTDQLILNNLASCHVRIKNFKTALNFYLQAIENGPPDANIYNNMALCLEELRDFEKALHYYEKAMSLDKNNMAVLINRASCLASMGKYEESLAAYDELLKKEPNNQLIWGIRADILAELGRTNEAVECYSRALGVEASRTA